MIADIKPAGSGKSNMMNSTVDIEGFSVIKRLGAGARTTIYLATDHLVIDHRDHNGLNKRRQNLRVCTRAENNHNQHPQQGNTSRCNGV